MTLPDGLRGREGTLRLMEVQKRERVRRKWGPVKTQLWRHFVNGNREKAVLGRGVGEEGLLISFFFFLKAWKDTAHLLGTRVICRCRGTGSNGKSRFLGSEGPEVGRL